MWKEIAEITRDTEFKENEEHLIDIFDLKVFTIAVYVTIATSSRYLEQIDSV